MNWQKIKQDVEVKKSVYSYKLHKAKNDTINFVKENPELTMAILSSGVIIATKVCKMYKYHKDYNEEKYLKTRFIYDRSRGCYYELRKQLTNAQLLEIDRRKLNGETLGTILESMRVLK